MRHYRPYLFLLVVEGIVGETVWLTTAPLLAAICGAVVSLAAAAYLSPEAVTRLLRWRV